MAKDPMGNAGMKEAKGQPKEKGGQPGYKTGMQKNMGNKDGFVTGKLPHEKFHDAMSSKLGC